LSGLQTTRRKYYPPQLDFIRLFLYPLRVSFNFVLFREYQKQPPYLLQIHPCIAFFVLQFPLYAICTAVQLPTEYQTAGNHAAEYQTAGKSGSLRH
jgi:hypothetical protein